MTRPLKRSHYFFHNIKTITSQQRKKTYKYIHFNIMRRFPSSISPRVQFLLYPPSPVTMCSITHNPYLYISTNKTISYETSTRLATLLMTDALDTNAHIHLTLSVPLPQAVLLFISAVKYTLKYIFLLFNPNH